MGKQAGDRLAHASAGGDPVADLAARLRELRAQAGSPSFRQLSTLTHYSSSALAEVTSGKRLPSEAVLRAFVTGCGGRPDEWVALLRQAAQARTGQAQAAAPEQPGRTSRQARTVAVIIAAACGLLAAGALLGAAIRSDPAGTAGRTRNKPAAVTVKPAADGADPVVAGCVGDARLADKSPVMLRGRQIGALEMFYSARCAAGWARVFLYPGQPTMLGEVTVEASDGRLAAFANPLIEQVPVYTDVISPRRGQCLGATTVIRPRAGAPATAAITCQNPAA